MATQLSREKAAQAWCKPTTSNKVMDAELAEAFAEILDEIWSRPWLGNATTGEMLDEIKARVDCSYRTVGPHTESPNSKLTRDAESAAPSAASRESLDAAIASNGDIRHAGPDASE